MSLNDGRTSCEAAVASCSQQVATDLKITHQQNCVFLVLRDDEETEQLQVTNRKYLTMKMFPVGPKQLEGFSPLVS